jgi:putrescine transport system permease protein
MRRGWFLPIVATLGFIFLYAPILSLIIFSFNESQLVTVWGGFSTKLVRRVAPRPADPRRCLDQPAGRLRQRHDRGDLGYAGGLCSDALRRFRSRALLTGMATAPLVMPEVITGLSLLLLFVGMEQLIGWPAGRGMTTIIIAHITFCMAFVAVVVQSRLAGMDQSVEEAAQDLGARPVRVFFDITVPVISPALVAGWLLAFTLSLDDLVIASFVTGPGASTLPMVIFSKVRLGVSPT